MEDQKDETPLQILPGPRDPPGNSGEQDPSELCASLAARDNRDNRYLLALSPKSLDDD
ncbi:MAG: hypothetical protein ACYDAM_11635 [Leptospirales bacterium]